MSNVRRRRRLAARPPVRPSIPRYRFRSRVNVPIENVDKGSVTFVRERSPANATMYLLLFAPVSSLFYR